ncbi:hypothetical protein A5874_001859, partial [Enterococcus faecium]
MSWSSDLSVCKSFLYTSSIIISTKLSFKEGD